MSKFPVESSDTEGVRDAVNYLLSGPGGLGQNFQGFSAYTTAYLTGNYRRPYSQITQADLYVAPIACSSAVQIDDRTFQYNFSSAQPSPPFALGNNIVGAGWSNSFYNGGVGAIGVIKCTTTEVLFRTNGFYPGIGDDLGGGTVEWNAIIDSAGDPIDVSTDANARVTVTGGTDRVFISGQLCNIITATSAAGTTLDYTVKINRYIGSINDDPVNPDYLFNPDTTVSSKTYSIPLSAGTTVLDEIQTVFSTVIDSPPPGYYWYIIDLMFDCGAGTVIDTAEFNLRSLSAQVVKQ